MADKFGKQYSSYEGPVTDGFAITPGAAVFTQPTRALYVGSGGNVCVQMISPANTVLTFVGVTPGTTLPIRVVSVFANSTAGSLLGLF